MRLIMLNVGGGKPQLVDKAVLGYPGKYTLCFGEFEEESPWDPLHVDRGFAVNDSVVTTIAVNSSTNILLAGFFDAENKLSFITDPFNVRGTSNVMVCMGEVLVVLTPTDAKLMASSGYSKSDIQNYIYDNSGFPEADIPETMERRERIGAVTTNGIVRAVQRPEDILIVVAGGPHPYHAAVMMTLGASWAASVKLGVQ